MPQAPADAALNPPAAPSLPTIPDQHVESGRAEEAPAWGTEERESRLSRLLRKARGLPRTPGVYLMKDHTGVVVYIGKALLLPDRVSSYFVPSAELGFKKQPMLEVVHDLDVIECETEWEALLTENRLIKDVRPKFNVRLTDDKTFPYLAITGREDFPRVFVTRNPSDPDLRGGRIFGPFTNAGALREALQILQRVFKFRTCTLDIVEGDPKNAFFRPCILYNIGQCTAPCAAKIGVHEYGEDIGRFTRFLGTKRTAMIREMEAEMAAASTEMRFERAAALRDQIRAIQKLDERASKSDGWQPETEISIIDPKKGLKGLQKILEMDSDIRCLEAIDIAHLQGNQTVASKVCFVDGKPLKSEYRRYKIENAQNDDYTSIREVVSRRYREAGAGHELYPDVILIDGGLGQLHAAIEAFMQLDVKPPMVISLAKKEELIYVQSRAEPVRLSRDNPALRMCQAIRDEAHRFAQAYHHVLRRKKTLEE